VDACSGSRQARTFRSAAGSNASTTGARDIREADVVPKAAVRGAVYINDSNIRG
jgi:hypothetical protein